MKQLILLFSLVFLIACHQKADEMSSLRVKTEMEKWKKQLLLNGEIGTPCEEEEMKWAAKNPEGFYGLPQNEIGSIVVDANNDGHKDLLLHFPAGDACSGSNEQGSDFLKLIYSDGNDYIENDNLRAKMTEKIELRFYEKTTVAARRAIFFVTKFSNSISGKYLVWTDSDPDCCPGYEGEFNYNPFTWAMQINYRPAQ
ncbi:MAG: hypothetical protein PHV20_04885 [Bacteroidales bacterium]|nr:hypothetical protein [Bacteroidales bacterium]